MNERPSTTSLVSRRGFVDSSMSDVVNSLFLLVRCRMFVQMASNEKEKQTTIDELCQLIDEATFAFANVRSRSSRLKRLNSSFLRRFRRLSTRSSSEPTCPSTSIPEDEQTSPPVETRRTTNQSCNVEELAAYLDNYLYLPKSLSGAAELMYT